MNLIRKRPYEKMVKDERKKTEDMEEEKHTAETSRVKRQNIFKVIEWI